MTYSSAGVLALIVHLIINHDVLRSRRGAAVIPAQRTYRRFLLAVTVYFVTDIFWGVLYEHGLIRLTFVDTAVYFTAMAFSILFWTHFVIDYLKEKNNSFRRILTLSGWLIFAFQMFFVVINFFLPILYSFNENGVYHAEAARYVTLAAQILMFLLSAVYVLVIAARSSGTMRLRNRTVGLASLAMAGFITAQALYPLLPLYAIGCLFSSCVMHSFVLENEKEEYREELEDRLQDNILKGNYYDLLTGLPGMTYFFELLVNKRTQLLEAGGKPAFLFFNLSGMKFYNQSLGFAAGDRLLRSLAELLISSFGVDNCSRLGQDHFAVFTDDAGLEGVLEQLFREWEKRCGRECPAILVGIYSDEIEAPDPSTACDLAKIACDAIRGTYVSSYRRFDANMYVSVQKQQYIIGHLDQAIEEKWIQVYYQPIVRATNRRVCDEEALARWIDPERGVLSPAEFIPILENAKLIYKLDLFVLEQVLEKMQLMEEAGLYLVPQSVNLSRSDFDSCDMVQEILQRVDASGLPHHLFTIEITESVIGSDFDFIKEQIDRFRSLGFPVWMDDFGSGYSSLDVLQSIQVDLIKFDMRFMQQFDNEEKSRIILTELMKMAIGLGIDTVCEGVEREDQVGFLREIGCSKLQGYYFSKPNPLDEVLRRYETGTQIGFENPAESGYYDAIGKINLYDLAVVAQDNTEDLKDYFSAIPMAIVEICGERLKFTRSNQAYRDFMERYFGIRLARLWEEAENLPEGHGKEFALLLQKCCEENGRAIFDLTLPSGESVHSFARRVAENDLTGTVAVAVVVLAVGAGK